MQTKKTPHPNNPPTPTNDGNKPKRTLNQTWLEGEGGGGRIPLSVFLALGPQHLACPPSVELCSMDGGMKGKRQATFLPSSIPSPPQLRL